MIEKKFVKLGRSWALIMPPVLLQLLKINTNETIVDISIENENHINLQFNIPCQQITNLEIYFANNELCIIITDFL